MKKGLLLLTFTFSLFAFATVPHSTHDVYTSISPKTDSVYICYSQTSIAYHSSPDCRGLNRCTHPIIKVTLYDATHKYGKRACKICE